MKAAVIGTVAIAGAVGAALLGSQFARVNDPPPAPPGASAPASPPTTAPAAAPGAAPASSEPAAGLPEPGKTGETRPDRLAATAPAAPVLPEPAGAGPRPGPDQGPEVPRGAMPAPSFDVVRVDPDGQTVIAGTSTPNQPVEVLLDGVTVETALADASGRFVVVVEAGASTAVRELRLRVTLPDRSTPADPEAPAGEAGSDAPAMAAGGESSVPRRPPPPGPARTAAATPGTAPAAAEAGPGADALAPARDGAAEARRAAPPARADEDQPSGAAAADADRQLLSDPVVILPPVRAGETPALVQSDREQLTLLQPAGPPPGRVVLDQLTRAPDGGLLLRGRARSRHAVRVYGNGREIGTVPVTDGGWSIVVPGARAEDIRLFRLDEVDRAGDVASRVEVPFEPSEVASQVLRDRKITVQRGDNLWRIAEQHYGEGLRYSLIFGANSDLIRDPDLIYPDQIFTVPELVEAE